jgi:hypothetical protein
MPKKQNSRTEAFGYVWFVHPISLFSARRFEALERNSGNISAEAINAKYSHADEYPHCITKKERSNGGTKSLNREMLLTQLADAPL